MWQRYRWWVILRSVFCLAGICLGGYLMVMAPGFKRGMFGGFLVMVSSLGFMRPMLWQMWHERGLRKHPAYETEVRYVFSDSGVKMTGKAGKADVPWVNIFQIKPTCKGLLIYTDKKHFMWIPKTDFKDGQMQEIAAMKG